MAILEIHVASATDHGFTMLADKGRSIHDNKRGRIEGFKEDRKQNKIPRYCSCWRCNKKLTICSSDIFTADQRRTICTCMMLHMYIYVYCIYCMCTAVLKTM